MKFVDEAIFRAIAGKGGNGAVSYRREAFVPRGGPNGGNGGMGGDVVLVASSRHPTLLDLKGQSLYRAENGKSGGHNQKNGRGGRDRELSVPVGTLVYDADTGALLADLVEPGQRVVVAKGGRGGLGNTAFKTAQRQTPDFATPGKEGESIYLRLELKVLADVGLVGMPNAGKSSLIRQVSASRAEVADYPFTTLVPNLGVVRSGMLGSFVIADIPGLVPGAHEGHGLGHQFLRHIERTRVLVHLVSASPDRTPEDDYQTIAGELVAYSADLANRPTILVLNKIDLVPPGERELLVARLRVFAREIGLPFAAVSCLSGEGIKSFQRTLETLLVDALEPVKPEAFDPTAY